MCAEIINVKDFCGVLSVGPLGYRYSSADIDSLESLGLIVESDGSVSCDPDYVGDSIVSGVFFPADSTSQSIEVKLSNGTWA